LKREKNICNHLGISNSHWIMMNYWSIVKILMRSLRIS
jgi:hypothetical protein